MKLKGTIFKYDNENNLIAYTNNLKSDTNIILIGGLEHNLLTLPYTYSLYKLCKKSNKKLIIPQFRTHPNYSIYPFDCDIEDLYKLIQNTVGDIIFIGNSTGCQVIITFINKYNISNIKLCILQGPVSDTEYFESKSNFYTDKDVFKFDNVIFINERFQSLYSRHNKEDLFSSYLDDNHFISLNKNNYKLVFVISGNDEYVVNKIDKKLLLVKNSTVINLLEGDHFLYDKKSRKKFIEIIEKCLL